MSRAVASVIHSFQVEGAGGPRSVSRTDSHGYRELDKRASAAIGGLMHQGHNSGDSAGSTDVSSGHRSGGVVCTNAKVAYDMLFIGLNS
jgi:hypothetical protein